MHFRKTLKASISMLLGTTMMVATLVNAGEIIDSELHRFKVETLVEGLERPWSLAFLPDGDMLVTERPGDLRIIRNGKLDPQSIKNVPDVADTGQGGLLDVVLHPEFKKNRLIYLSYSADGFGYGTEVARARLNGNSLDDVDVIFQAQPKTGGGRHFGSRLLFTPDGHLLITLGDRGKRGSAQSLGEHSGSIIRLHDDGRIPADNPFVGKQDVLPEIYTYGNRNVQGIALQPGTNIIWAHEHGPQGGDEVNIIKAGVNYGWPVITYGANYGSGTKIGEGTQKQGMEQPIYYWDPSIAPSGMTFYSGDQFPDWRDNLFVGSLKFGLLVRLALDGEKVVQEEGLFNGRFGRIRDVRQGPDGLLYVLTDARNAKLLKVSPQ